MSKKMIAGLLAVVLVLTTVIGGTLAYLTSTPAAVKNTFTVGNVDITLTEEAGGENHEFHMVPGQTITKDPKVTVTEKTTEDSYVFVKLDKSANYDTFLAEPVLAEDWTRVEGETNVWYRVVTKDAETKTFDVLQNNQLTVNSDVTNEQMTAAANAQPTLTVTAYAIQQAGFATAELAWAELNPKA